jgi:hypothetical protein
MNTTYNTKTKLLAAAVGIAAATVAPALLFAGAGTAQANGSSAFISDWSDCDSLEGFMTRVQCKAYGPTPPVPNNQPLNPDQHVWNPVLPPSAYDMPYNPTLNNPNAPAPATMGPRDPGDDGTYRPPEYPAPNEAPEAMPPYLPEVVEGD